MSKPYIDHHVHTVYSVLDGAIKIKEYVKMAIDNNMPALFMSDHGDMSGTLDLYLECKKHNIKSILGSEFYISDGILDKEDDVTKKNYHLCLYAKNLQGYKNLVKLTTYANVENFYNKPRITFDKLKEYSEGLICTTACVGSQFAKLILDGKVKESALLLLEYKKVFGEDLYIEYGYHGLDNEKMYVNCLNKIAEKLNIKTIIGNDSHYLYKEDHIAHKIVMCKGLGNIVSDEDSEDAKYFNYKENYYKNRDEITETFSIFPQVDVNECIDNTYEIIDKCENYEIKLHEYVYPELPNTNGLSQDKYLEKLIIEGCKKRYNNKINNEIKDRIKYEFSVIKKMNFSGYFNVVADYTQWCKNRNILVGPGRGSAAGSIISYVLNITDVDPLKYNLLFERFLNPDRDGFPDIDIDFSKESRDTLMEYLHEKYGPNGCVQISTRGYLKGKSAIKTVASRLGLEFMKYNTLLSGMTDPKIDTVDKCLEANIKLQTKYDTDPEVKNVIDLARRIEGNIQSVGVHASGVILCQKDITDITPIIKTKDGYATAFYDKIIEKLGLIKYDILGLSNLSTIKETLERINSGLTVENILSDLTDENTYKLLQSGESLGIFQLESDGMKSLLSRLKPENINHIDAVVALFRPGAMQFIDQYIENKNNPESAICFDENAKEILKDTYFVMVYQEQVMQIARTLAGYTMSDADSLRRAIGKKNLEEMQSHEEKFINGCTERGMDSDKARTLYEQIVEFANYSFNKSHSISYAHIAYITAYLKANYTVEYMTALLNANCDNNDKLSKYIDESYRLGIDIRTPDINKSNLLFEHDKENKAIIFGFNGIKGMGNSAINSLIAERKNGEFKSFINMMERMPSINKKTLECLIKSGALNSIEQSPYKYLPLLDFFAKVKAKADYKKGNITLYNGAVIEMVKAKLAPIQSYSKLVEEEKGIKTSNKNLASLKEQLKERISSIISSSVVKFEEMQYVPDTITIKNDETELLGFPISVNPKKALIQFKDNIKCISIKDMKDSKDYHDNFVIMASLKNISKTRNGSYFAIFSDESAEITTFISADNYENNQAKLITGSIFRIYCQLGKSYKPEKYDDNLKPTHMRYFNIGLTGSLIKLKCNLDNEKLSTFLTKIRDRVILNEEDINYRLEIENGDSIIKTNIDFWVSDLESISDLMIEYNVMIGE